MLPRCQEIRTTFFNKVSTGKVHARGVNSVSFKPMRAQ